MTDWLKKLIGGDKPLKPLPPEEPPKLPIEMVRVRGADALAEREKLLARPGCTAIILGSRADVELMEELVEQPGDDAAQIIARAGDIDVVAWLRERREQEAEYYQAPTGKWPNSATHSKLSLHLDGGRPKESVYIGIFPTPRSWEAPAFVRQGGWNEVPEAEYHVALHRRWHDRYGSTIACMSSDIIECTVERPPTTRDAAMELAQEQFVYCSDIVHQGVETLEALAATLLDAKAWYFWWD